ncbi:uncharacterized protein EAE97_006640 [Botrytis byssoidea]|uniref:F-box domain-containing protein n=1 Tax=Botrytis byssoidea TaxID=139641 RepID=A0A9P5IKB6_9HELO|nr:uncharacterized protein EAE97_006640 [Botrytis byssoidea]KAF7941803.1 hypothetical protein EAE97_006640 [Botrytis byssoidea]
MESIPRSHDYEKLDFSENPFEKLPRELLLPIVKFTSDLASVWSLSSVSPAVHLLIDDFGKEIVETILEASEPKQIRVLFTHIYFVHDVEPPSWIELKRITRAIWYIQAIIPENFNGPAQTLIASEIWILKSLWEMHSFIPQKNAALTVALYLSEAHEDFLDQPEKYLTSFSQLPDPVDALVLVLPIEQKFEDPKSDLWRQSISHLDDFRGIPGLFVPRRTTTVPPLLGFAIWDRKRMFCFGLANKDGQPEIIYNVRELIFKYLSILPPESAVERF